MLVLMLNAVLVESEVDTSDSNLVYASSNDIAPLYIDWNINIRSNLE